MAKRDSSKDKTPSSVFKVGAIALAFLIIGFQSSLFMQRAAALRIAANRDRPDTVYVYIPSDAAGGADAKASEASDGLSQWPLAPEKGRGPRQREGATGTNYPGRIGPSPGDSGIVIVRRNAEHSAVVERERRRTRRVESFRFDPNTVSVEDLMRLGFSEKQAQAIDSYRQKGGRFRRPSDFGKSYVVADSVFERLKPFIDIPKLDINKADSAAFDGLPGIGPYYAAKMVEYRGRLGGYSFKEQLMDIWHFDREKYDGLSDLIVCSRPSTPFRLWQMPEDSLRQHPYIRSWQAARSIALFRKSMPREQWTVEAITSAGILPPEDAAKLARCVIADP